MRILHLIPTLVVGGAERMAARLAIELRGRGHDAAVAAMYDPLGTWIEAELRDAGVPLAFLGKRRGLDVRVVPRLARVMRRFRPDVVHTHMYVLKYAVAARALSRGRWPIVHTVHTLAAREEGRLGRLAQWAAFRAGVVPVAIGAAVAESFAEVYGRAPHAVIENGVPIARCVAPAGARERVRAELGIAPGDPVFACVAQFVAAKDHETLLDAFAAEPLRAAGAHLLLAGDGERRPALEARAREAGLDGRVRFLGVRSDVPALLAAADAFVLASRREGNPLSVMEAMAAGKPIVATAVGCVPELVDAGAGRLVPPGRPDLLAAAMAEIAAEPARARAMGAAAAAIAAERFDDARTARRYERLYEELT